MAKPSNTVKLVVTSIIISLIVLAVFVMLFLNFIVPAYQITEEQIYSVMVKLFPILIGLALIQIGVMVAKRGEPEYKDTIDRLSPNAYDSSLYTEPKDDPMARGRVDGSGFGGTAQEPRVIEKEVPVEVIREVPVEVIKKIEVPVEIIREVQVPVEIIKEVPVDKIVIKEVVKEVPVEKIVEKEVIKEIPIEVIKEVPVEVVREVEKAPEMLGFREVLDTETRDAVDMGYDLSLVAVKEGDGRTAESVEAAFEEDTLVFDEGSSIYAILPLYTKEDAEKAAESLEPKKIASVDGRKIGGSVLIEETRF